MTKYIIELPDTVTIKKGVISIAGNAGWSVIEKSIHNARKAVEVHQEKDSIVGSCYHQTRVNGEPVALYAVKKDK